VRKTFFPRQDIRQFVSLQEWFRSDNSAALYLSFFDPEVSPCYSWACSKDGYFMLGGAFEQAQAQEQFALLKQRVREYGFDLGEQGEPSCRESCLVSFPERPSSFCLGDDRIFLLGEAAGFISPSSLEGLSYAFDSAAALSKALTSKTSATAKAYRHATFSLRLKLLKKRLNAGILYNQYLRALIMKSRIDTL
jgi:flavin-dependent dehydrogenase